MARHDGLDIERLDAFERSEPLPRVAFLQPAAAFVKDVVAGKDDPLLGHQDRGLRCGVAGHVDDVEGVVADVEGQRVVKGQGRRVGGRVVGMADQPHAVGVGFLEALAFVVERAERIEIALEAFLQFDLADDLGVGEIGVAGDVVAMRLGVDQVADRRLVLHPLAPAHRVDRLLRRVDHDIAVAGLDKARVAAGEIDFGIAVGPDPAHRRLPRRERRRFSPIRPGRHKAGAEARCRRCASLVGASRLR